jgi:hypothetical protein
MSAHQTWRLSVFETSLRASISLGAEIDSRLLKEVIPIELADNLRTDESVSI